MINPKIVILGAGVSGLCTALYLAQKTNIPLVDITIIEKENEPGGLIRSSTKNNYHWDNGIFMFFDDHHIVNLEKDQFSQISDHHQEAFNNNHYENFPLQIRDIIATLPKFRLPLIFMNYIYSRTKLGLGWSDSNFHDWLEHRLTAPILERTGLEPYIEKLQGLSAVDISNELGPLRFSFIDNATQIKSVARKLFEFSPGNDKKKTTFPMYHFINGANAVASNIAKRCEAQGVKLMFNSTIDEIRDSKNGSKEIHFSEYDGQGAIEATHIISTIPIDQLVSYYNKSLTDQCLRMANKLSYRKMLLLFFEINRPKIKHGHFILYSLDPNHCWKRLQAHSRPGGTTSLIVEIPYSGNIDNVYSRIYAQVVDSLTDKMQLFAKKEIILTHDKSILNAYPIYALESKNYVQKIISELNYHNIYSCGRQGGFKYVDSNAAIFSAISTAEIVLKSLN